MAITGKSMFLYGIQVTENNASIDFQSVSGETVRMATLRVGFYSLTSLANEISRAMHAVDTLRGFAVTVDRTFNGGLENRIRITSSGTYCKLLLGTGPRTASTVAALIGFNTTDYSGALYYDGARTAGVALVTSQAAYTFLDPDFSQEVFGTTNVAASGLKEAIVFSIQRFWQCEYKYEPKTKVKAEWLPFWSWAISQRLLEFTPEITSPALFYEGTLEKSEGNAKGMGFKMSEMLPQFQNLYKTGLMTFRVND